jgi:predicted membrane channel-forming protein YqfA (hemolysin III family)
MYTGIRHLHSTIAYVALACIIIALLFALISLLQNKGFNRKMASLGLIATHTQVLVGFIMYFVSPMGYALFDNAGEAMKDSIQRLYLIEHPLMMIISVVLVTIGFSKAKKATDPKVQNRTIVIFYGIGLLLILSRIPWHVWPTWM